MILSFHPCYSADKNRMCAGRDPDEKDMALMRKARAVILPQGCRRSLFEAARINCTRVFPDYTARFAWPDKTGQIRMFRHFAAPHPETAVFENIDDYLGRCRNGGLPEGFDFPLVFKYNGSGEGSGVWPVFSRNELDRLLEQTTQWEKTGQYGFLLQRLIETGGRCLRVAVIGKETVSYWRVQKDSSEFIATIARGAVIDHESRPGLRKQGEKRVRCLCSKTGINLAGFDLIFPAEGGPRNPMFLEVNYYFGRRGLGGSKNFYRLLCREIDKWIAESL